MGEAEVNASLALRAWVYECYQVCTTLVTMVSAPAVTGSCSARDRLKTAPALTLSQRSWV